MPVEDIRSTTHEIDQVNLSPNTARINLRDEKIIPNKDFILRYDVTGKRIEDAVLTHRDERGGFFTLILQPPDRITSEDRTPKEIVFVLDTSGSMSGFPIEKAKEAMRLSLDGLYPEDTFNLITFAGDTAILFDKPVPATRANLDAAQEFLAERQGYGGTEMMKAIKAALEPSDASDHLRVVCFMTDGEVGNDDEIVAEVQRHPKARVFSFGIGSSVNRSLLDRIAHEGRGEAEYVALTDDGSLAAKRFYERVRSPLLTDLSVEWNGLPVSDVYPGRLTDLFSAKPVIIHGRYDKGASGTIKLRGNLAGQPYERNIKIDLPETSAANDALASLWARTRIDDLTSGLLKAQTPARATELQQQITSLALKYRLMTEYTSFVAVEDNVVNPNGAPVTIKVPVQLPEGMIGSGLNAQMDEKIPRSVSLPAKVNNASTAATGASTSSASSVGISATVDVSAANSSSIDTSSTAVSTTISSSMLSSIPIQNSVISGSGVGYGSGNGVGSGSEVEGASGTESTFIIDGQEAVAPSPPTRNTTPNVMSAGVLTGRAIKLPKPAYPAAAQAVNAQGSVVVQLLINEDGSVASARALSGHPLLRAASEKAAALATFTPVLISGKAVKVTGVVTYNFSKGKNRGIRFNKMKVTTAAPADLSASRAEQKLHVWLYAIVERLRKGGTSPTPNEATFVHDGKAEVAIELTSRSPEVLEKLKASGFELTGEKGKFVVTGMIALDRLGALADIGEVDLVLPVMR